MNTMAKKIGITMLTAATAFAPLTVTTAQAGQRGWRQYDQTDERMRFYNYREYSDQNQVRRQRPRYRNRNNNGDAIALGILGLGVGAIIGGAIANSQNNPRVIYRAAPAARDYHQAAPRTVSGGRFEAWTQPWFRYCSNKYRSFNASSGTYRGYDGQDHFCVAR